MNGKTHQISGAASTLTATWLAVEHAKTLATILPDWFLPIVTPPTQLLNFGFSTGRQLPAVSSLTQSGSIVFEQAGSVQSGATRFIELALTLVGILLVGIVAGQFPDIDTPDSTIANSFKKIGKRFRFRGLVGGVLSFLIRLIFWVLNLLPYGCALIANKLFGHRGGVIHGLIGWFGFSLIFGLIFGGFWGFLFWVGYFTHLVVDSLSRSGVKWLWPLSDRCFHIIPVKVLQFRTDNPFHNAAAQSVFVVLAGWVCYSLAAQFLTLPASNFQSNSLNLTGEMLAPQLFSSIGLLLALGFLLLILVAIWFTAWQEYRYKQQTPA